MAIETIISSCGSREFCEGIVDGKIDRCRKYIALAGQDPQTGEPLKDEFNCADVWQVVIQLEGNSLYRGTRQAIESMRNETVSRQDAFISLAHQARIENGKA